MSETIERDGKQLLPDCLPENQSRLTGHNWCPGWDNCECECHRGGGEQ